MVLGVIFIILKIAGITDTSWIWVLSPFWIGPVLMLALYVYGTIIHRDD